MLRAERGATRETEGLQPTLTHGLREGRQGREGLTDEVVHDGFEVLVKASSLLIHRCRDEECHVHGSQLLNVSISTLR